MISTPVLRRSDVIVHTYLLQEICTKNHSLKLAQATSRNSPEGAPRCTAPPCLADESSMVTVPSDWEKVSLTKMAPAAEQMLAFCQSVWRNLHFHSTERIQNGKYCSTWQVNGTHNSQHETNSGSSAQQSDCLQQSSPIDLFKESLSKQIHQTGCT